MRPCYGVDGVMYTHLFRLHCLLVVSHRITVAAHNFQVPGFSGPANFLNHDSGLTSTMATVMSSDIRESRLEAVETAEQKAVKYHQEALHALEKYQEYLADRERELTSRERKVASHIRLLHDGKEDWPNAESPFPLWYIVFVFICVMVWGSCALLYLLNYKPLMKQGEEAIDRADVGQHMFASIISQHFGGIITSMAAHSAQENRDRFAQERRHVAVQLVFRGLPLVLILVGLYVAILVGTLLFYVWGWIVLVKHYKEPCDQPLNLWLVIALLIVLLDPLGSRQGFFTTVGRLFSVAVGYYMYSSCRTCQSTNPELHFFVNWYMLFMTIHALVSSLMTCSVVGMIYAMQSRGLLDARGPDSNRAAKPGLIKRIPTVIFGPSLFAKHADECCVCQGKFTPLKSIKRTSCGHIFHEECLGNWLSSFARTCPLCRADLEELHSSATATPTTHTPNCAPGTDISAHLDQPFMCAAEKGPIVLTETRIFV